MEEIWKAIKGYEGFYEISNLGRVKSLERMAHQRKIIEKIMVTRDYNNYEVINLSSGKDTKVRFFVHRLVAKAFIENPDNKNVVNHLDRNRYNNKASNLSWVTYSENTNHYYSSIKVNPILPVAVAPDDDIDGEQIPW